MAKPSTEKFTKDDFLSPKQMAEKFNLAQKDVENVMMRLYKGRVFKNGGRTPYIIRTNNKAGADKLKAHPLAQEEIVKLVKEGSIIK